MGLIRIGRATAGVDGVDFAMLREDGPSFRCFVEKAAIVALAARQVTTGEMLAAFDLCRDRGRSHRGGEAEAGRAGSRDDRRGAEGRDRYCARR